MAKRRKSVFISLLFAMAGAAGAVWAGPPGKLLPAALLRGDRPLSSPVDNAAYIPAPDAATAQPFSATILIEQSAMRTLPVLDKPLIDGRDARLFPGVRLGFFSMGNVLVPESTGGARVLLRPRQRRVRIRKLRRLALIPPRCG